MSIDLGTHPGLTPMGAVRALREWLRILLAASDIDPDTTVITAKSVTRLSGRVVGEISLGDTIKCVDALLANEELVGGTDRELIAAAIANARGRRRGVPTIKNVLDMLPEYLRKEVLDEADSVIAALRAKEQSA